MSWTIHRTVLVLVEMSAIIYTANTQEWSMMGTTLGSSEVVGVTTSSTSPNFEAGEFQTSESSPTIHWTGRWLEESTPAPSPSATSGPIEGIRGHMSGGFAWYPISWTWVRILQLISAIVGIIGNLLVMLVLFQRRKKSRSTDVLIGGLASADFITSIFLTPMPWPAYVPKNWMGELYCRLVKNQSLLWASITASTYLLMSISMERYIAVVYPLHFKHLITRRRVSIFIVIIWVMSILSGVHAFIVYGVKASTNICGEQYSFAHAQTIIAYYWFCLRLAVPCLTMLITQILIARKLSQESRNFEGITNTTVNGKQVPSFHIVARKRILKMMLIVILIYVVFWTPNQIAYLGYNLGWVPQSYLNSPLQLFLTVLGFYNSCANPIIYTARYAEFREALKDVFTCTSPQDAPLFEKGDLSKNTSHSVQEA